MFGGLGFEKIKFLSDILSLQKKFMEQEGEILKINIYGAEYPIKRDAETDAEYILKVAEYVDEKMREIEQNVQSKSSLKVAILAALNITDELFQEKVANKSGDNVLKDRIKTISENLDQVIQTTNSLE